MGVGRVNDAPPQMRQRAKDIHRQSAKAECNARMENFLHRVILPKVMGSYCKVFHHILYDDSHIAIFLVLGRREPPFDGRIGEK